MWFKTYTLCITVGNISMLFGANLEKDKEKVFPTFYVFYLIMQISYTIL